MSPSHRSLKVADRIKVVVAQILETKIKDPRLGFITVTDARVTGDLQMASIFYTVLGDLEARASTAAARDSSCPQDGLDQQRKSAPGSAASWYPPPAQPHGCGSTA